MSLEYNTPHLLTREDITSILNERHLKIPNIELMSYQELLRIYETFAQPLEKRHTKCLPQPGVCQEPQLVSELSNATTIPFPEAYHVHHELSAKCIDFQDSPPKKYLKLSFNTFNTHSSASKKRPNGITINGAQEATAPKRKPITWP